MVGVVKRLHMSLPRLHMRLPQGPMRTAAGLQLSQPLERVQQAPIRPSGRRRLVERNEVRASHGVISRSNTVTSLRATDLVGCGLMGRGYVCHCHCGHRMREPASAVRPHFTMPVVVVSFEGDRASDGPVAPVKCPIPSVHSSEFGWARTLASLQFLAAVRITIESGHFLENY